MNLSNLYTGFLGVPAFKQMLRWFPNSKSRVSHAVLPTYVLQN
jgi:hypothetical protein